MVLEAGIIRQAASQKASQGGACGEGKQQNLPPHCNNTTTLKAVEPHNLIIPS